MDSHIYEYDDVSDLRKGAEAFYGYKTSTATTDEDEDGLPLDTGIYQEAYPFVAPDETNVDAVLNLYSQVNKPVPIITNVLPSNGMFDDDNYTFVNNISNVSTVPTNDNYSTIDDIYVSSSQIPTSSSTTTAKNSTLRKSNSVLYNEPFTQALTSNKTSTLNKTPMINVPESEGLYMLPLSSDVEATIRYDIDMKEAEMNTCCNACVRYNTIEKVVENTNKFSEKRNMCSRCIELKKSFGYDYIEYTQHIKNIDNIIIDMRERRRQHMVAMFKNRRRYPAVPQANDVRTGPCSIS